MFKYTDRCKSNVSMTRPLNATVTSKARQEFRQICVQQEHDRTTNTVLIKINKTLFTQRIEIVRFKTWAV